MAQSRDSISYSFELSNQAAYILPHRESLRKISEGTFPKSVEFGFSWLNASQKGFYKANRYAENGLIIGYTDFDNQHALGQGYYYMMYTEPKLVYNKSLNLSMRAAGGIIYLNRVYSFGSNPENMFYSSPLSGLLRLGLNGTFSITKHWQIGTSVQFNHISNGGMRVPNLGMNFISAALSIKYQMQNIYLPRRNKKDEHDRSLQYHIYLFTASRLVKDWDASSTRKQMLGTSLALSRSFNHLSSWMVGTEVSYDASLPETGKIFDRPDDSPWIVSLTGGHLLTIGRVEFSQILGVYLYKRYDNTNAVFQRYTLLYAITPHLRAGFSLKAHAEIAELIDLRLGINFKSSSKR